MNHSVVGFNGERSDPEVETFLLGNGYRTYNPVLMRFNCPDDWSPFGVGGINAYAYCVGDPVTRADPSGHHSLGGWLGIGVGLALGLLLTPVSAGSSLAAALSVVSIASAVASTGLAVAQQFLEEHNPKTAALLGWAALSTGIVSALSSVALSRVIPGVKSLVSLVKGSSNRPFGGGVLEISTVGGQNAQAGTQFGNPRFIGLYEAEDNQGYYMAFSFTDHFEGLQRLNIVGTASVNPRNNFAMGSGRWMGRYYERSHMGSRALSTYIRRMVAYNPGIRSVRLAVPYSASSIDRSGTFRRNVELYLINSGTHVQVTAPFGEYRVHGPVAGIINQITDGLHTDQFEGLFTAGGQRFTPETAQALLNQLSERYANVPDAFHINIGP